jgi:hypothetical protein
MQFMESPKVIASLTENFYIFDNGLKLALNWLLDNLGTISAKSEIKLFLCSYGLHWAILFYYLYCTP